MNTIDTSPLRNCTDRGTIIGRLQDVSNASTDIVAPQSSFYVNATGDDSAVIETPEPVLTASGVHSDGVDVTLTESSWNDVSHRLDIPRRYVRRLRSEHPDLIATNVNVLAGRDDRTALYRLLDDGERVLLRAMLSDGYRPIDNLDVMTAAVRGLEAADIDLGDCDVQADWTNDRFRLRIQVPAIELMVPDLLSDYRTPWSMNPNRPSHAPNDDGSVPPVMFAGIEIGNSETGNGAQYIVPRAEVLICRNGLRRVKDIVREVHIGKRLDAGVVQWGDETRRKSIELVTAQVADAARTFCSVTYLEKMAAELREAKGVEVPDAAPVFEQIQRQLSFTEEETNAALNAFIASGDRTMFGAANAVTAAAQLAEDGDRQTELEDAFWSIVNAPGKFVTA